METTNAPATGATKSPANRVRAISGDVYVSETRGDIVIMIDRYTPEIEQGIAMVEAENRQRLAELVVGVDYRIVPAAAVPDAATIAAIRIARNALANGTTGERLATAQQLATIDAYLDAQID